MLRSLSIRDFVIVDRLELEFRPGFTVLTGETGAGKSILIDALSMVLGERAEAIVVRSGAERAEVSAQFDLNGDRALAGWLKEQDLEGEDGELLLRRVIEASGRSRGYINGRGATAAQLREAGERLVDMRESDLADLPLEESLREAIATARRITSRGARARQLQYIGKLMRAADMGAIEAALAAREDAHRARARLRQ